MLVLAFVSRNTSIVELCLIHSVSLHSLHSLLSKIWALLLSQGTTSLLSMVEAKGPSVLQFLIVVCVPHLDKGSRHPLCSSALLYSASVALPCVHPCISFPHHVTSSMPCAHHPVIHPPLPPLSSVPIVVFPCPSLHNMPCITACYTLVSMQYATCNSQVKLFITECKQFWIQNVITKSRIWSWSECK